MQLDPDPETAKQQIVLWIITAVSFFLVIGTVGFKPWYAPLLTIAPTFAALAFIVYRARKKRRDAGVTR